MEQEKEVSYPFGTVGYLVESLKYYDQNLKLIFASSISGNLGILSIYDNTYNPSGGRPFKATKVYIDIGDDSDG